MSGNSNTNEYWSKIRLHNSQFLPMKIW
jgi:hypothetical protein